MPNRIRVAMVHGPARPEHDGVSDYVSRLVAALGEVDVQVWPLPVRPTPERRGWWSAVSRAARTARALRPDLVHVQFAPAAYRFSGLPGLLPLLLPAATPLVTTVHEYGWWAAPGWLPAALWRPVEQVGWWDRETGRLVPASAAVLATNHSHLSEIRQRTGRAPVEVPLAPNVTVPDGSGPSPGYRERARQRLGLGRVGPVLLFFGFVHPVKGLRYLIEALADLRQQWPDMHLLVVGGFTSQALPEPEAAAFRDELLTHAHTYQVASAVTFTGHLPADQVAEVFAAADLTVLPFTEGVTAKSGSLLATWAHGLPTAVTLGQPPDPQLQDGETVAVIPARRDPHAIAAAVARLCADDRLRQRLAEAGPQQVRNRTWPQVATTYRAVYEGVLAGV